MRQKTPAQRLALGVQRHLQDAVAPLEAHGLVFVGVVLEPAHRCPPANGAALAALAACLHRHLPAIKWLPRTATLAAVSLSWSRSRRVRRTAVQGPCRG